MRKCAPTALPETTTTPTLTSPLNQLLCIRKPIPRPRAHGEPCVDLFGPRFSFRVRQRYVGAHRCLMFHVALSGSLSTYLPIHLFTHPRCLRVHVGRWGFVPVAGGPVRLSSPRRIRIDRGLGWQCHDPTSTHCTAFPALIGWFERMSPPR